MGLDAVELVLAVEETFGIAIPDSITCEMRTPAMMIAYVQNAVGARPDRAACISLRAFHRVRAGLMKATGVDRSAVTLKTPINKLFLKPQRLEHWRDFKTHAGLPALPDLGFGTGWLFTPTTVNHLVETAVKAISSEIRDERTWTNEEVRQIIRTIISEQLAIGKFHDHDDFIRDLGLD